MDQTDGPLTIDLNAPLTDAAEEFRILLDSLNCFTEAQLFKTLNLNHETVRWALACSLKTAISVVGNKPLPKQAKRKLDIWKRVIWCHNDEIELSAFLPQDIKKIMPFFVFAPYASNALRKRIADELGLALAYVTLLFARLRQFFRQKIEAEEVIC